MTIYIIEFCVLLAIYSMYVLLTLGACAAGTVTLSDMGHCCFLAGEFSMDETNDNGFFMTLIKMTGSLLVRTQWQISFLARLLTWLALLHMDITQSHAMCILEVPFDS